MPTSDELKEVMEKAHTAFSQYKEYTLRQRADFMRAIAKALENVRARVVPVAMEETHLPEARLNNELSRTIFQLNDYAANAAAGRWLDARINIGKPKEGVNIRKMLIPLGPVVVFGASNFPFAYSTAGGDTACALAAGCPVIVKGHPGHARTSEMVAEAVLKAAEECQMPDGIFSHVAGDSFEIGQALVKHPLTKAVGFTGSLGGGKALFDLASQRDTPIPVFAEMGSVNPVWLLPDKLKNDVADIAKIYGASITQDQGQFCTNPGLIFGMEGADLNQFIQLLSEEIKKSLPGTMLHDGIAKGYWKKREKALAQKGVTIEAIATTSAEENMAMPTLASASGSTFLQNKTLHQEVFGPYSLVIKCKNTAEMEQIMSRIDGQLTSTLMATEKDMAAAPGIMNAVREICGRLIMNGVPTGVSVCTAMQHGGPYPATTDSRFTSVGSDGIRRFARPLCFQNFSDALLPDELKDSNPLRIWRTVNDVLTKDPIE